MRLLGKLTKANYRMVVLPAMTLATGVLAEPRQYPDDIIMQTRLRDCLLLLRGD